MSFWNTTPGTQGLKPHRFAGVGADWSGSARKPWFHVVRPVGVMLAAAMLTAGCAPHAGASGAAFGAPAIPLFDAFFPAWLLCAFFGVIGAVLVRVIFIRIGLDDILPLRLPVYVAVATIIGLLVSLIGFGR